MSDPLASAPLPAGHHKDDTMPTPNGEGLIQRLMRENALLTQHCKSWERDYKSLAAKLDAAEAQLQPAPVSAGHLVEDLIDYWFARLELALYGKSGNTFTLRQIGAVQAVLAEMLEPLPVSAGEIRHLLDAKIAEWRQEATDLDDADDALEPCTDVSAAEMYRQCADELAALLSRVPPPDATERCRCTMPKPKQDGYCAACSLLLREEAAPSR